MLNLKLLVCACGCPVGFCPVVLTTLFPKLFLQLLKSLPVGVGQIYGCDSLWTGLIFLGAILLSSPLMCLHAAVGSLVGVAAGKRALRAPPVPHPLFQASPIFQTILEVSASKGPIGVATSFHCPRPLPKHPAFPPSATLTPPVLSNSTQSFGSI